MDTGYKELLGDTWWKTCMACDADTLLLVMILEQKGIPPGLPGYEMGYSHILVVRCGECGRVSVEKMSRDTFDYETSWENMYEWLILNKADAAILLEEIGKCPEPVSPKCGCGIHQSLRSSLFYLPMDLANRDLDKQHYIREAALEWQNDLPKIVLKRKPE